MSKITSLPTVTRYEEERVHITTCDNYQKYESNTAYK